MMMLCAAGPASPLHDALVLPEYNIHVMQSSRAGNGLQA